MRDIWNIMKKDLDKIFKYPRMILSTVLLPGLLLFIIYAFMGSALSNQITEYEEREKVIHLVNAPESFEAYEIIALEMKMRFIKLDEVDMDALMHDIETKAMEVLVVFEEGFDAQLGGNRPNIDVYYNPTHGISNQSYSSLRIVLSMYQNGIVESLLNQHGLTSDVFALDVELVYDEQDERKLGAGVLAMLLPMLIVTFIFSGSLSVGSDAIAGEKERGTLPTLLMAPIKRSKIIYGKIFSTTIIAVLTAISSFIGIIASIPFSKDMFAIDGVTLAYELSDYLDETS